MRKYLLLFLLAFSGLAFADDQSPRQTYIETYKDIAMREMRDYGIPASITLAQGILESADGKSRLATKGNNHFGIKCHGWKGKKIYHDDDAKGECFRVYDNAEESYKDHSIFLTTRSRYDKLFTYKQDDYKSWAKGLKKAGYATNPKYPKLLIKIIEENDLFLYDRMVLEGVGPEDLIATADVPPKEAYDPDAVTVRVAERVEVKEHPNDIKYIVVTPGLSYAKIEEQLNVWDWEIRRYNDLPKTYKPVLGDSLFIQPKRNRSRSVALYTVKPGDTLLKISQIYGVKIKAICRKNGIKPEEPLVPGQVISLKRRKR